MSNAAHAGHRLESAGQFLQDRRWYVDDAQRERVLAIALDGIRNR